MSKSTIIDFRIRITPSTKLKEFLGSISDVESMPKNVITIYEKQADKKWEKGVFEENLKSEELTSQQRDLLKQINLNDDDFASLKDVISLEPSTKDDRQESCCLELNDLKWINKVLVERRAQNTTNIYLHDLLQGSILLLPENEYIPRNPELEARIQKLKQHQDNLEYKIMTKNVDVVRRMSPDDSFGFQMRAINRQLIAVLQFIFSVAAGFAFGFIGVELIVGNLDFGFRLLLGIICSLIIALAEIYFLAKKLNEYDDSARETPPSTRKEHQD